MNIYSYIDYLLLEGERMTKENCLLKEEHEWRVQNVKAEMPTAEEIERECNVFRMLGEPSRLKIVLALMQGEMCVYHLVECCGGTQSGTSHQLRILKDNRVVKSRREGQNVLYSLADEHIVKILELGKAHTDCE